MPRLTNDDLQRIIEKPGYTLGSAGKVAKLEQPARDAALEPRQGQEAGSGRFLVRVTSFRRRLLDEDNLCEKYHVDCCRYAGLLPTDTPDKTKIEVSQVKVGTKEKEYTLVEITPP